MGILNLGLSKPKLEQAQERQRNALKQLDIQQQEMYEKSKAEFRKSIEESLRKANN